MTHLPRRTVLASTAALIAGCTASETQPTDSETPRETPTPSPEPSSPTTTPDTETATQTPETDTPTPIPTRDVPDPDQTIQYGETSENGNMAITVELPTIDTSFTYEGDADETYEMPDGQALAFVPVTFENTHEEERRRMYSPSFYLASDELGVRELRSIRHPAFEESILQDDLKRIDNRFGWWGIKGDPVYPGEVVHTHILFVVHDIIEPVDTKVLYDPTLGTNYDYYSEDVVAWTATGQ